MGELKTRSEPKSHLQAGGQLENAALALHQLSFRYCSRLQSATSSPKITMRSSRRISSRRVAVNQIGHRLRRRLFTVSVSALGFRRGRLSFKGCRSRVQVGRIDIFRHSIRRRRRRLQRTISRCLQIVVYLLFQVIDALFIQNAFPDEKHLHARNRIALRIALPLGIRAVQTFVVGERVGIGADYMRMDKRRPMSRAAVRH